ncbi:hypothetical protein RCL1_006490 [Eukaryota sp. TZLM3-RCL]
MVVLADLPIAIDSWLVNKTVRYRFLTAFLPSFLYRFSSSCHYGTIFTSSLNASLLAKFFGVSSEQVTIVEFGDTVSVEFAPSHFFEFTAYDSTSLPGGFSLLISHTVNGKDCSYFYSSVSSHFEPRLRFLPLIDKLYFDTRNINSSFPLFDNSHTFRLLKSMIQNHSGRRIVLVMSVIGVEPFCTNLLNFLGKHMFISESRKAIMEVLELDHEFFIPYAHFNLLDKHDVVVYDLHQFSMKMFHQWMSQDDNLFVVTINPQVPLTQCHCVSQIPSHTCRTTPNNIPNTFSTTKEFARELIATIKPKYKYPLKIHDNLYYNLKPLKQKKEQVTVTSDDEIITIS